MNKEIILKRMQDRLPDLLALYAFGSRIKDQASAESDLDLAVLVAGYADPLLLFDLAGELAHDVLLNKAATIERCVLRAREEYAVDPATFAENHTRQDAAILNIQRACEATLDMGQHLIRRERLGIPQSARDVFALLAQAGWIDAILADKLKR